MRRIQWMLLPLLLMLAFSCAEEIPDAFHESEAIKESRFNALSQVYTQPCIYITTEHSQPIISKEEYVPAVVDVFNCEDGYRLTAAAGVKVRGNSTANDEKERPYRIKFESKQNMLGLHGGRKYKSWVLLRAQWNLASDYMALNLAHTIFDGRYYASDCTFVNVFINGEYTGLYVLCEQNQAAKGRIEIHEPEPGETDPRIGYLLELDNYPSDEHPYFIIDTKYYVKDIAGQSKVLVKRHYSIKNDLTSDAQFDFIQRYMDSVFRILFFAAAYDRPMAMDEDGRLVQADDRYASGFEAASAVIDMDSLANMLILEELVHNYDVGEGSFFMAVDFSADSLYPRLTFLGPWDFNWGYDGKPDGGYYAATFQPIAEHTDRSNSWMILAMKMPEFRELVKEKWRTLSESSALDDVVDRVMADCESLIGDLGSETWRYYCALDLGNFVRGRIRWLDTQWR